MRISHRKILGHFSPFCEIQPTWWFWPQTHTNRNRALGPSYVAGTPSTLYFLKSPIVGLSNAANEKPDCASQKSFWAPKSPHRPYEAPPEGRNLAKVKSTPLTKIQNRALFPNPKFLQSQNNRKKLLNSSGVDFDHIPRSLTQKTLFTGFKKSAVILLRNQYRPNSITSSKIVRLSIFFSNNENLYRCSQHISKLAKSAYKQKNGVC